MDVWLFLPFAYWVPAFHSFGPILRSGIAGSHSNSMSSFLRNHQTIFQRAVSFYISTNIMEGLHHILFYFSWKLSICLLPLQRPAIPPFSSVFLPSHIIKRLIITPNGFIVGKGSYLLIHEANTSVTPYSRYCAKSVTNITLINSYYIPKESVLLMLPIVKITEVKHTEAKAKVTQWESKTMMDKIWEMPM